MGGESKESNNPRMKPSTDVTMLQTNTIKDNVDKDYTPGMRRAGFQKLITSKQQ